MIQFLVEEEGVDVNKATNIDFQGYTPLHIAVENGHIDVAVCLMERGMANLNAKDHMGQRPMDVATNEAMRQAIINEEKRRRDHGFKRSVIPPNHAVVVEQEHNVNEEEEKEKGEEEDEEDEDSDSSDEEDEN